MTSRNVRFTNVNLEYVMGLMGPEEFLSDAVNRLIDKVRANG